MLLPLAEVASRAGLDLLSAMRDILAALNIPNPEVIYYGWQSYGAYTVMPNGLALEGALGSVDDLRDLAAQAGVGHLRQVDRTAGAARDDDVVELARCVAFRRHGIVKTHQEWLDWGEPGSDNLLCDGRCRCDLIPDEAFEGMAEEDIEGGDVRVRTDAGEVRAPTCVLARIVAAARESNLLRVFMGVGKVPLWVDGGL